MADPLRSAIFVHTTENDYNRDVLLEHKDEQTVDIPFTDPNASCIINDKALDNRL